MRMYNVNNVSISITTTDGEKYLLEERHEDGFKSDPANESSSETVASNGEKVVNIVPDESTSVSLSLTYGSEEDKIMHTIYTKWKSRKGTYSFDITVRDNNLNKTIQYTRGAFTKRKAYEFGHETGTNAQTWEMQFEKEIVNYDN